MQKLSKSLNCTVPLGSSAHSLAEKFCRKQSNRKKGKQVYLNTLAVSAVQFYLNCMEIETDWEASFSWDLIMQTLMDVADLDITGLGKLECRPVLPESQIVHIPPEVWLERIGYVAVQFDSSLRQATLLGFAEIVTIEELPVTQLRSLTDLLEHLNQIRQLRQMKMRVNLSQWLDHLFADGWQSLEALLATNGQNLALNFRNDSHLSDNGVRGAKLIDLELQLGNQSVVLLVGIAKAIEEKMGILVQVHPISVESYLPAQLRLSLLSEAGSVLQEVRSRTQDCYIQMKRFWVESGEKFSIQVALDEAKVTENFVI